MAYVKIKNSKVVQKQPYKEKGFIEAPEDVVPGYDYDEKSGEFSAPKIHINFSSKIKTIRDNKISGGINVGGIEVDTDDVTQARMTAVRVKAGEDSGYTVQWKTKNGFMTLDAATIIAVSDAIHDHVQACFAAEALIDFDGMETLEDLETEFEAQYSAIVSA